MRWVEGLREHDFDFFAFTQVPRMELVLRVFNEACREHRFVYLGSRTNSLARTAFTNLSCMSGMLKFLLEDGQVIKVMRLTICRVSEVVKGD